MGVFYIMAQKACFYMAKHGLLQCKSRPFIVLNKALSVAKG